MEVHVEKESAQEAQIIELHSRVYKLTTLLEEQCHTSLATQDDAEELGEPHNGEI